METEKSALAQTFLVLKKEQVQERKEAKEKLKPIREQEVKKVADVGKYDKKRNLMRDGLKTVE